MYQHDGRPLWVAVSNRAVDIQQEWLYFSAVVGGVTVSHIFFYGYLINRIGVTTLPPKWRRAPKDGENEGGPCQEIMFHVFGFNLRRALSITIYPDSGKIK